MLIDMCGFTRARTNTEVITKTKLTWKDNRSKLRIGAGTVISRSVVLKKEILLNCCCCCCRCRCRCRYCQRCYSLNAGLFWHRPQVCVSVHFWRRTWKLGRKSVKYTFYVVCIIWSTKWVLSSFFFNLIHRWTDRHTHPPIDPLFDRLA